mmetsp:Transcript_58116/g.86388  ORF Transcript_58116/g.86388 Transcript_58116/m.86388 type:complete len:219 (-) Transcript_58116:235-891(-)
MSMKRSYNAAQQDGPICTNRTARKSLTYTDIFCLLILLTTWLVTESTSDESFPQFYVSEADVTLNVDNTENEGVLFTYNVTTPVDIKYNSSFEIYFHENCSNFYTQSSQEVVDVISTRLDGKEAVPNEYNNALAGNQTLEVLLDIRKANIANNPFLRYTDSTKSIGKIEFCITLVLSCDIDGDNMHPIGDEYYFEDVSYRDVEVILSLNLIKNFTLVV